jgi:hypothetical protein
VKEKILKGKKQMRRMKMILIAGVCFVMVCGAAVQSGELAENLRKILEKNEGLGLEKFPIGFWNYTQISENGEHINEAEVAGWADAGFTVPMSPGFRPENPNDVAHIRKVLDWTQQKGLKLILVDSRATCPPGIGNPQTVTLPKDFNDRVDKAGEQFGKHPALFGFHIGDEPISTNNKAYFEACRKVKKAAPQLHPHTNLLPWWPGGPGTVGYPSWPEYLDAVAKESGVEFLCYDCYSQMLPEEEGKVTYFRNLRFFREASWRNGVPFWTTILSTGLFNWRCPSYNDLNWQFYTAICCGAKGIMWYQYHDYYAPYPVHNLRNSPINEFWEKTQTYYDLRKIHRSFHKRYGDLFSRLVSTRVSFYPEAIAEGEKFTPDELLAGIEIMEPDPNHPLVIGEFADKKGQRFVMIVSNITLDKNAKLKITFAGKGTKVYAYDWNGKEYLVGSAKSGQSGYAIPGWWISAGQEFVFRVDSEDLYNSKAVIKPVYAKKSAPGKLQGSKHELPQ